MEAVRADQAGADYIYMFLPNLFLQENEDAAEGAVLYADWGEPPPEYPEPEVERFRAEESASQPELMEDEFWISATAALVVGGPEGASAEGTEDLPQSGPEYATANVSAAASLVVTDGDLENGKVEEALLAEGQHVISGEPGTEAATETLEFEADEEGSEVKAEAPGDMEERTGGEAAEPEIGVEKEGGAEAAKDKLRITGGSMVLEEEKPPEAATETVTPPPILPRPETECPEGPPVCGKAGKDVSGEPGPEENVDGKKKEKVKVDLKGYRYLKYRTYSSTGEETGFVSRGGLSQRTRKIEQGTSLGVNAKVGDDTRLGGDFYEMPNQDRKMKFRLEHENYGATLGNFSAKVEGGELSPFSKTIDGIQFDYVTEKTKGMFMSSKSKSQTQSVTFTGRNIKGPYELNARDLMPEGIVVKLNNVNLSADEYILDPFTGEISFLQILGPDDKVTVTFEKKLTGGVNEGALSGMSVDRRLRGDTLTVGFSRITREAAGAGQKVIDSVRDEIPSVTGGGTVLTVKNRFVMRSNIFQGSESIVVNGRQLEPNVDYNLLDALGEARIFKNYAAGVFVLKTPLAPGDSVKVSYSYFPGTVIQRYEDVELVLDQGGGNWAMPDPFRTTGTIYYGSEEIILCDDEELTVCDELAPLEAGVDYYVDEDRNRVYFLPSADYRNKFPKISLNTYPDFGALDTKYDHTVSDFRIKYEPKGRDLAVSFERASSEADISTRPIAVINEIIRPAAAGALDCTDPANRKACTLSLSHQDIVAGTLVLYFNDRISDGSVIPQYGGYVLDPAQGSVEMIRAIPAGATIIADYQYEPPFIGVTTGNMDVFRGRFRALDAGFRFNLRKGDTYFTPIGGESNFEVRNLSYGFDRDFGGFVSVTADWITVDNATDLEKTHLSTSRQSRYSFNFKPKKLFTSLTFNMSTHEQFDDYNPAQTDSAETRRGLTLALPVPFLKNADASFSFSDAQQDDNTQPGVGRSTSQRNLGVKYKPTKKLEMNLDTTVNEIESRTVNQDFTSTNTSRKIGVRWKPLEIADVNVDLDSQETTDSRSQAGGMEIQSTRMGFSLRPKGRVRNFAYSFSRQDSPSISGPSTSAQNSTYTMNMDLTKTITFTPRFSVSTSSSGSQSGSENQSRGYGFEYTPPGRPYRLTLQLNETENTSSRPGGSSTSTTSGWDLSGGYDPDPKVSYMLSLRNESQSSSKSPGYESLTVDARMNRKPSEKVSQTFGILRRNRSGGADQTDTVFNVTHSRKISKILSFNLNYRLQKYENGSDPRSNFTGQLFESTFRADF